MTGLIFHQLHALWKAPERGDEYFGTLINAYLKSGGQAVGVQAGRAYIDVGTLHGYREASQLLSRGFEESGAAAAADIRTPAQDSARAGVPDPIITDAAQVELRARTEDEADTQRGESGVTTGKR